MVLESCMILLDNSEFMRNGDYIPTRIEAQHDAANFLVQTKTQSNPENTVGVIAMCGTSPASGPGELLVSPTDDMGKILSALHGVPVRPAPLAALDAKARKARENDDGADLVNSLQVANLALKHRRNKNGAQRVIVFVGSPVPHDSRALVKAGKMLKKNNLAIDVIAMGELEENEPKLKELVDAANGTSSDQDDGERTCHLVTIPSGCLPSDVLVSSPIIHGGRGGGGVSGGDAVMGGLGGSGGGADDANAFAEYGGIDPNLDPELAMALRVSMEEERARQERAAAAAAAAANSESSGESKEDESKPPAASTEENTEQMQIDGDSAPSTAAVTMSEDVGDDEDALLQQALAMSMAGTDEPSSSNNNIITGEDVTAAAASINAASTSDGMMDDEDEDAAMQLALQMSMQPDSDFNDKKEDSTATATINDPQFVNQLLGSTSDPELQNALSNMMDSSKKNEKKDNDDDKKEDKK